MLFLTSSFSKGQKEQKKIEGIYQGYWADTYWEWSFWDNNKFHFSTRGHFGFTDTDGSYFIKNDTIYVTSYPKSKQYTNESMPINETLLIDGDSCIIDPSVKYDYCKQKQGSQSFYMSRERKLNFPKGKKRKD